jgi:hypothetical protein
MLDGSGAAKAKRKSQIIGWAFPETDPRCILALDARLLFIVYPGRGLVKPILKKLEAGEPPAKVFVHPSWKPLRIPVKNIRGMKFERPGHRLELSYKSTMGFPQTKKLRFGDAHLRDTVFEELAARMGLEFETNSAAAGKPMLCAAPAAILLFLGLMVCCGEELGEGLAHLIGGILDMLRGPGDLAEFIVPVFEYIDLTWRIVLGAVLALPTLYWMVHRCKHPPEWVELKPAKSGKSAVFSKREYRRSRGKLKSRMLQGRPGEEGE